MSDPQVDELARMWESDGATGVSEVDWAAIGLEAVQITDLDPQILEALTLLEPPAPHPWRATALPHQLEAADAAEAYVLLCAGRGCVAPWTRIYLPDEDRHERIDVLARQGRPVTVQAWTSDGLVSARTDGAPFLKGFAHQWTVTTDDGREITVTDRHRFLSPQGWLYASEVRAGQLLGAASHGSWARAESVRYAEFGPFYDMTVPGPANYVAEGLINHNSGKTHAASHVLTEWVEEEPGDYAIVAPTFGDALRICADGPSGFIKAAGDRVESFNKNEFVIYMKNGSRIVLASADAPDRIRGWNLTGFWADEMASWRKDEVWDEGLEFATRIGRTRRIITTTPKRGSKILKDLLKRGESGDADVRLIRASTRANAANLSEVFLRTVEQRYAGTTLGRQELDGVLLDDVEGALVTGGQIEKSRVRPDEVPELWRIVVGVDPAVTNTKDSDETGIVVAGIGPAPEGWQPLPGQLVLAGAPHVYLLEDVSGRRGVNEWARQVLITADEWAADAIVAEKNQGGDLVDSNIRLNATVADLAIPRIQLVHAAKGKYTRAEPVGALFQQGRLHVVGTMPKLEDNWTEHVPGDGKQSPDRMDASVWSVVGLLPELGIGGSGAVQILSAG